MLAGKSFLFAQERDALQFDVYLKIRTVLNDLETPRQQLEGVVVRLGESAVRSLSLAITAQAQFILKRHVSRRYKTKALVVFVVKRTVNKKLVLRLKLFPDKFHYL